ncbi:hypothetical protein IDH28_01935 [Pelagibacterales bacterium SAG-MED31]|nr:hypothetical protein [Pelagibacterales bacterium SAG-MED31]
MNFIPLFKFFFLFLLFFVISCNSVEKIIDQNFKTQKNIPKVNNLENKDKIFLGTSISKNNFEVKFYLEDLKNTKNIQSKLKTIFFDNKFFTFNSKSEIFIHNSENGELFKNYQFIKNIKNDNLVANYFYDNHFILGYSSGKVTKVDLDGNIKWSFQNNKLFNSNIYEFNGIIIIFYGDEIIGLNFDSGNKLWSENYEDLPIIQAKGGIITNFFNDIYFVLPNGRLGSVDSFLGTKNNNKFVNLQLQKSINNANDKIYIHKNFLTYLDEGEFIYTYDLLSDEFLLYNFKINSSTSNYFFNNALIIKNENYIEAINILNGNTYWLIDSKLNKNSDILNIKNINNKLTIFLNNGKILLIDTNGINKTLDLRVTKTNSFHFF